MTRHADPPSGAISYEEHQRRVIAEPGVLCGPPVVGGPTFWENLFPFLKPAELRELEHLAREAEHRSRELEIGG